MSAGVLRWAVETRQPGQGWREVGPRWAHRLAAEGVIAAIAGLHAWPAIPHIVTREGNRKLKLSDGTLLQVVEVERVERS